MENFTISLSVNNSVQKSIALTDNPCNTFTNSIALKALMAIAYIVIMGTSIVGNTILAFVYYKSKNMKNTVNCCIMNMVFADLLLTFVYMPRMVSRIFFGLEWMVEGTLGLVLCKIVSLSQEISICVSILTVVVIAFERFFAVAFPLRVVISKKLSIGLLCGTWLVSLAVRSPMFYGVKTVRVKSGELGCVWFPNLIFQTEEARKFYHGFIIVIFYGLPLLCIISLYTTIVIFLRRRQALIDNMTRDRALATNKKVTKMILAVISAFLLCWMPYFLVMLLKEFWKVTIPCKVHFVRFFLGHVNSACNPIICLVFSENYRNGIKNRNRRLRWKRPGRYILRVNSSRDRSRSNIELLTVRILELDDSIQHFRGTLNPSFQYDETRL
ncbi:QRFP-like peptide receptor [Oculina patagonica]